MKRTTKFLLGLAFLGFATVVTSCTKDNTYTVDNQDFVTQASSSNMFEITAAGLALQKSTNADVMAFANHMLTDHGTTAAEMASLASRKGWTIPTTLMEKHQTKINALSGLAGPEFDRQYAAMMVTSHQETITLFEQASNTFGVPDIDLRNFTSGKLPALKEHLDGALQLQTKVGK